MIQTVLVLLIFLGAIGYVGRMIYNNFRMKSGCPGGCGKCAIDFDKIGQQIDESKR